MNAPRVLSVYGGDGSVARMAHLALEFDRPFMPLPGGTFNHFSRSAGIESVDLAIDALQAGSGIAASVGELTAGGRTSTVMNAASIGIYPEFVAERTKRKARLGKWIGGVAATWRGLRDAEPIDIVIGGRRARVWSVFASVGRNTPGQVATFQRRTMSDDVLDVRVLHARGSRLQAVAALSFGAVTRAVLRALRLLPPASDIEHITATEIAISVRPRVGRGDVLRARRGADAATGGRRGRPLHADMPDRAEGAAPLRPRTFAPAGGARVDHAVTPGSSLRCMRMALAADAATGIRFVASNA